MADRIVLNTISYHGHGAIENIVPELTAAIKRLLSALTPT